MTTSNIKNWSKTPASNNSSPPNGAPEGMNPGDVNDVMRENMAAIRTLAEVSEWFDYGDTAVYVSATSFKIVGSDVTSTYPVGRRVRITSATPGTIYGTITASVFGTDTTVTVDFDSTVLTSETLDSSELSSISPTNKSFVIQSEELYAIDTGVADAYIIDIVPAPSAYVTGQSFVFKAINANTGASTINVNGLGVTSIVKYASTALSANDILNGQVYVVVYDGANFQLVGMKTIETDDIVNDAVTANKLADTSVTAGSYTATDLTVDAQGRITAAASGISSVISSVFTSSEQSLTAAGGGSISHGLGSTPVLVQAILVCKIATGGYAIGDEVALNSGQFQGGTTTGLGIYSNTTNVNFRFATGANIMVINNASSGAMYIISAVEYTKWRLKIRAWV